MMNCDKYRNWILLQDSGELNGYKSGKLQEHLAECAECRKFARGMELVESVVSEISEDAKPHPSVLVNIRAAAEERLHGSVKYWWQPAHLLRAAAYAAIFLVIAGGAFVVRDSRVEKQRVETLNALVYLVSDESNLSEDDTDADAADIHDVARKLLELDGFDISGESEDEAILSLFGEPDPTTTQWHRTPAPRA
jgi:hypothetical protein